MPGWHPPRTNNFGNHLAPAGRLVVRSKCEWTNLSRAVALNAASLQNRCHIARISDRTICLRFVRSTDDATDRIGLGIGNTLAGQQFIDCQSQVLVGGLIADDSDKVLIVDAPLIADHALPVE